MCKRVVQEDKEMKTFRKRRSAVQLQIAYIAQSLYRDE